MLRAMIDMDHLPYLAWFLAGVVVAMALGVYLSVRSRARMLIERLALLLCPAAVYITLVLASIRVVQAPDNDWNAARLAPAVALLSGVKLYVGPGDPGAAMNTNHPPLAYLAYLPAGLFSRATPAILAGSCISAALYFAPAFVLCFWRRERGPVGRPLLMGVACLLVFFQAALISKALGFSAFFIHADAPMLAFTGFASLALYLKRRDTTLSPWTGLVSTSCASMAFWSELSAAPLILVLPVWVLATRGFREMLRYTTWPLLGRCTGLVQRAALPQVVRRRLAHVQRHRTPEQTPLDLSRASLRRWPPDAVDGILLQRHRMFVATLLALAVIARRIFTPGQSRRIRGRGGEWTSSLLWSRTPGSCSC